jgi:hypothetical protein
MLKPPANRYVALQQGANIQIWIADPHFNSPLIGFNSIGTWEQASDGMFSFFPDTIPLIDPQDYGAVQSAIAASHEQPVAFLVQFCE